MPASLLRLITQEQLQRASAIMERAFENDPLIHYMFPDPVERAERSPWYYAANLKHSQLFGEVWATANWEGVAAWLSPAADHWSFDRLQQSGLWQMSEHLGEEASQRFMSVVDLPVPYTRQPYYYLFMLGVEPDQQGRGIGSRLLSCLLQQADSTHAAIRVDTNDPANVSFYERHGFEVIFQTWVTPQLGQWAFRRRATL
jgi:ribosomal protein S18 acetylase RimI-like enzyme